LSNVFVPQFKIFGKLYESSIKLWTVDYLRSIDPEVIPYNKDNEDGNIQPGDVLNWEYKEELSLDDWMYIQRHARHSSMFESSAWRLQNPFRIRMKMNLTGPTRRVSSQPRQRWAPRMTIFALNRRGR